MQRSLVKNPKLINKTHFVENKIFEEALFDVFAQKQIFLVDFNVQLWTYWILTANVFFGYRKILKYREKLTSLGWHKFGRIKKFQFYRSFSYCQPNFKLYLLGNYNRCVKRFIARDYYYIFVNFIERLFIRRRGLFSDFLNLTTIFLIGKLKSANYLRLLCEIFTYILKRKHKVFFTFITLLFRQLVLGFKKKTSFRVRSTLAGIKMVIRGRIGGFPRARRIIFSSGIIPLHTASKNISFSKRTIFNRYGTYGFKLWVNHLRLKRTSRFKKNKINKRDYSLKIL